MSGLLARQGFWRELAQFLFFSGLVCLCFYFAFSRILDLPLQGHLKWQAIFALLTAMGLLVVFFSTGRLAQRLNKRITWFYPAVKWWFVLMFPLVVLGTKEEMAESKLSVSTLTYESTRS